MPWYPVMIEVSRIFKRLVLALNPRKSNKVGRPAVPWHRAFAPFCRVLIYGLPWRCLPKKYGSKSTLHRIFQKCMDSGLFKALLMELLKKYRELRREPCLAYIIDSTTVFSKGLSRKESSISAQYSPKRGLKLSIITSELGVVEGYALADAKTHDLNLVEETIESLNLHKTIKKQPEKVLLSDNAYTGSRVRDVAKKYHLRVICPLRRNQKAQLPAKDTKVLKKRSRVERTISWVKQFRRLDRCYEKSLLSYEGFLCIGLGLLIVRAIGLC